MFTKFKVKVYLQAQLKLKFTAVQIYAKIVIGSFNIIYGPYHLWCKTVCNKKSFRKHRASCVGSKIGFRFLDQQSQAKKNTVEIIFEGALLKSSACGCISSGLAELCANGLVVLKVR